MKHTQWVGLGLVLALAVGCGGEKPVGPAKNSSVKGTVTFGGKAVTNAFISFESPGVGAWGQELTPEGGFDVKLAEGDFTVTVVPVSPKVDMSAGVIPAPPKRDDIPEVFRTAATSKLKTTVKAGSNTFEAKLD